MKKIMFAMFAFSLIFLSPVFLRAAENGSAASPHETSVLMVVYLTLSVLSTALLETSRWQKKIAFAFVALAFAFVACVVAVIFIELQCTFTGFVKFYATTSAEIACLLVVGAARAIENNFLKTYYVLLVVLVLLSMLVLASSGVVITSMALILSAMIVASGYFLTRKKQKAAA